MKKELTIEEHYVRMHHHRITDKEFNEYGAIWTLSINAREKIKERLEKGYKVKTGWTTSAIRGYHHYYILFKC
jgi:hypothetical protein